MMMTRFNYLCQQLDRLSSTATSTDPNVQHIEEMEDAMRRFTEGLLGERQFRNLCQNNDTGSGRDDRRSTNHVVPSSSELRMIFKGDEQLLQDLAGSGAIDRLLDVILRNLDVIPTLSPGFFNNACLALMQFAFENSERSRHIFLDGGLSILIRLMERYRSYDYIQIISIAVMMVIGKNVGFGQYYFELPILNQVVIAMEHHYQSHQVYTVAVSALETLYNVGSTNLRDTLASRCIGLWNRGIDAICYGLIVHQENEQALYVGNNILCSLVGPDDAEEMIRSWEQQHLPSDVCSIGAAAA